ncbi:MAG: hypothetical protein WD044_17590 [Dongiaceae bacterium]
MQTLVTGLFAMRAASAIATWIVAVAALVRVPWHTIDGPLRGPDFLRAVDTFHWIFGKGLVLPMLHPDNLTPRGQALRKRALVAGLVFFLCCFAGTACGLLTASPRGVG